MANVDEILEERQEQYGDFADVAMSYLQMTGRGEGITKLQACVQTSYEMIAMKLARIVNGDSLFEDSWDDIIGYAELARTEIKKFREWEAKDGRESD